MDAIGAGVDHRVFARDERALRELGESAGEGANAAAELIHLFKL